MGEIFEEYSEKNRADLPPLTIIQGGGTVYRDESNRNLQFDKNSLSNYKAVNPDDFIVHLRSFEGGLEKATYCGLISPAYHTFHGDGIDSDFYYLYFRSKRFIDTDLKPHVYGIRDGRSIDIDGMKTIPIPWTTVNEQRAIGGFYNSLDSFITLHQRKCQYRGLYGYLSWEQRKLGELGFAQSGIGFPDTEQGGTEGTPFFKVSDMNMPGNEHELVASNNYVTPEQIARMGWHPINQVPAIFFAKVGAAVMLNRKRLVNKPFLLDNNTMAFSMDSSLLNTQFGQSLFERLDLTSLIQVGALPSYNSSDVESITVSLPSTMDEQRRIGQCLCNINDLITLHQRQSNGKAHNIIILSRTKNRQLDIAKSAVLGLETRGNSRKLLNEHPIQQRFLDIP